MFDNICHINSKKAGAKQCWAKSSARCYANYLIVDHAKTVYYTPLNFHVATHTARANNSFCASVSCWQNSSPFWPKGRHYKTSRKYSISTIQIQASLTVTNPYLKQATTSYQLQSLKPVHLPKSTLATAAPTTSTTQRHQLSILLLSTNYISLLFR